MQRLGVSGAVRPIYGSLGDKRLKEQNKKPSWDTRIILCSETEIPTVIPSHGHEEPTLYESHVRIINIWNTKWLTVLQKQNHLVRNSTDTGKGTFVPSSPHAILSRTPSFRLAARANRCHIIAIGLYSVGIGAIRVRSDSTMWNFICY